jgi:hypothetical protein
MILPLTHSAGSDAKNPTTRATSAGMPTRFKGDSHAAHCGELESKPENAPCGSYY